MKKTKIKKVYKVCFYEAYRMDEKGIRYMFRMPKDTVWYKHEILGSKDFSFPDWEDGELVTNGENTFCFVSGDGVKTYQFE